MIVIDFSLFGFCREINFLAGIPSGVPAKNFPFSPFSPATQANYLCIPALLAECAALLLLPIHPALFVMFLRSFTVIITASALFATSLLSY